MKSFLRFYSTTAAILNIDYDHVDTYANLEEVIDAFAAFSLLTPPDGTLVVPAFDPGVASMMDRLAETAGDDVDRLPRIVSFGMLRKTAAGESSDSGVFGLRYEGGLPLLSTYRSKSDLCMRSIAGLRCAGSSTMSKTRWRPFASAMAERGNPRGGRTGTGILHRRGKGASTSAAPTAVRPSSAITRTIRPAARADPPGCRVTLCPTTIPGWCFNRLTFSRTRVLFDDFVEALLPASTIIFPRNFQ
jgi:UDP-N-acetylmuramate--alanine ligase